MQVLEKMLDKNQKQLWKIALLAILLFMLAPGLTVKGEGAEEQGISVHLDGLPVQFTEEPMFHEGNLLVQLRPVLDALGLQVGWDPEESAVLWSNWSGRPVRLKIGSGELWIDDDRYELPVQPQIRNGSTLIPLRYLMEKLSYLVDWSDPAQRVDVVTDGGYYVFLAATDNDLEEAGKRLEEGAAANFTSRIGGATPLGMALHQNNLKLAELLLQYGADPNVRVMQEGEAGFTLLAAEAYKQNMAAVKLLLRYGADAASGGAGSSALDMVRIAEQEARDETVRAVYQSILALLEQGVQEAQETLSSDELLIPFNVGEAYNVTKGTRGAWGFQDRNGKVVIEPRFAYVRLFSEGLAFAVTRDGSRTGYIDRRGSFQITMKRGILNVMTGDFDEGLAPAGPNHDSMGYMNKEGQYIVPPVYEWVREYSEGYAVALKENKWFVFDRNGEQVLETDYDAVFSFHDGLALVRGKKNGFINLKGELVIDFEELGISEYGDFREGLASVRKDGKMGYIDQTGSMVIPAVYEFAGLFLEGLAPVKLDGKYGYIDLSGRMVIEPQYESADYFSYGRAFVKMDGKYGMIDKTNKLVLEPEYDAFTSIMEGSILRWAGYYSPVSEESQGLAILYKGEEQFYLLPDGSVIPACNDLEG